MKLILASSSTRRAEIMRAAGISFEIRVPQIDEAIRPGESAQAMVARLAEAKARACPALIKPVQGKCIVIGADTAVELEGKIFGKPRNAADAREMLSALSGQSHHVHTGIFLLQLPEGSARANVETTFVKFGTLEPGEIESYIASGEPFDKAGAYAIQGRAGRYISGIDGCYFNVVGLPLAKLYALLHELGWSDHK